MLSSPYPSAALKHSSGAPIFLAGFFQPKASLGHGIPFSLHNSSTPSNNDAGKIPVVR